MADAPDSEHWDVSHESHLVVHACVGSNFEDLRAQDAAEITLVQQSFPKAVVHHSLDEVKQSIEAEFRANPAILCAVRNRRPTEPLGAVFSTCERALEMLTTPQVDSEECIGAYIYEWLFACDKKEADDFVRAHLW
jgi:hypothetical protein